MVSNLEYSKRQTAYAWSQVYEARRVEFTRARETVHMWIRNELSDEIPIGLDKHLMGLIKGLYKDAKAKIDCPICMCEIDSETLKTGKCGHNFHQDCVDQWIATGNRKCPQCRKKF